MSDDAPPGELTPDEIERLTTDRRLRDYPAVELFETPREQGTARLLRWLVAHDRFEDR